jgi:hypothetical protein
VLGAFGASGGLRVWDHSPLARSFALANVRRRFEGLKAAEWADGEPIGLLVVSHVLNELDEPGRLQLASLIASASATLWVEPGTRSDSQALVDWRERLLATHRVIAPCTHQGSCGLRVPGRERDWCHHFARPPAGVHADARWVRFAQRAGIDLRSLPYSFLVLERQDTRPAPPPWPEGTGRLLGRPEFFKPYARVLNCDQDGVTELTIPKRTAGTLYKQLEKVRGPLVYQWRRDGATVTSGEPLLTHPSADQGVPPSPP